MSPSFIIIYNKILILLSSESPHWQFRVNQSAFSIHSLFLPKIPFFLLMYPVLILSSSLPRLKSCFGHIITHSAWYRVASPPAWFITALMNWEKGGKISQTLIYWENKVIEKRWRTATLHPLQPADMTHPATQTLPLYRLFRLTTGLESHGACAASTAPLLSTNSTERLEKFLSFIWPAAVFSPSDISTYDIYVIYTVYIYCCFKEMSQPNLCFLCGFVMKLALF